MKDFSSHSSAGVKWRKTNSQCWRWSVFWQLPSNAPKTFIPLKWWSPTLDVQLIQILLSIKLTLMAVQCSKRKEILFRSPSDLISAFWKLWEGKVRLLQSWVYNEDLRLYHLILKQNLSNVQKAKQPVFVCLMSSPFLLVFFFMSFFFFLGPLFPPSCTNKKCKC